MPINITEPADHFQVCSKFVDMEPTDDPINYKFGVFYYNPADKRVIVPKKTRHSGFTINFAHKGAVLTLVAILLAIIIMIEVISRIIPVS